MARSLGTVAAERHTAYAYLLEQSRRHGENSPHVKKARKDLAVIVKEYDRAVKAAGKKKS